MTDTCPPFHWPSVVVTLYTPWASCCYGSRSFSPPLIHISLAATAAHHNLSKYRALYSLLYRHFTHSHSVRTNKQRVKCNLFSRSWCSHFSTLHFNWFIFLEPKCSELDTTWDVCVGQSKKFNHTSVCVDVQQRRLFGVYGFQHDYVLSINTLFQVVLNQGKLWNSRLQPLF